ncbi:GTP cyclohydrolase 1 type 2 [Botrimarina colliarenosi]|uniref:GTP cyclohydrolase 1 type 2 homolog n=1 Tax=Botrimarina colliarenosi TaxID=2528001 RepID=A0A5C6AM20_9BACT|nr:Nif3-like dinuclear metal center hexameric protein [Botrimarina colliarenosi]TWU00517.1 GTP cyclohydrolase 1 type 2 [Botrimarina colliarenosi]
MPTIADACRLLEAIAPLALAEEWDNVGLLVGDPTAPLRRVLTCLTLTPDVVDEAIAAGASLVVTHHPLPFRGVKTLTTSTIDGGSLWRLAAAGVAVYSPHTAYDSAAGGVNQQWADRLGLTETRPLAPPPAANGGGLENAGVGRVGRWPEAGRLDALVAAVKRLTNQDALRVVMSRDGRCERVAIACGSGGSLLELALGADCDVFLTGEMSFHDCLRCRSLGVGVVLTGHYASERFAVETLARRLAASLDGVPVAASEAETDPLTPI